jgi:VIT1/CCC1 family predicted Fe2+/Mn2+ transporter
MADPAVKIDERLARRLILDEMFDLSLYKGLRDVATGEVRQVLDGLIPVETRHLAFWQEFSGVRLTRLDFGRRLKLALLIAICRLFGTPAIHLVLEAIEVYGVRKYLALWRAYGNAPLGNALREVLVDEFKHEDAVVTGDANRRISPERIRNIFLGLNDGLTEILGAVSGFFAAFQEASTVLIAGSTVAVAGAISMAAGAYVATSSEAEVRGTERERQEFLGERVPAVEGRESALASALLVGASYLLGALIPVLPVVCGARTALASLLAGGSMIILVSMIVAFLSGMDVRRRVVMNVVIITAAVGITYLIGVVTRSLWGIAV